MRIGFSEKVKVVDSDRFPDRIGKTGVVLGISEEEDVIYSYLVFFAGEYEGLPFLPHEINGTGELVPRSEFYDEKDMIRVRVENGRGFLIDENSYRSRSEPQKR